MTLSQHKSPSPRKSPRKSPRTSPRTSPRKSPHKSSHWKNKGYSTYKIIGGIASLILAIGGLNHVLGLYHNLPEKEQTRRVQIEQEHKTKQQEHKTKQQEEKTRQQEEKTKQAMIRETIQKLKAVGEKKKLEPDLEPDLEHDLEHDLEPVLEPVLELFTEKYEEDMTNLDITQVVKLGQRIDKFTEQYNDNKITKNEYKDIMKTINVARGYDDQRMTRRQIELIKKYKLQDFVIKENIKRFNAEEYGKKEFGKRRMSRRRKSRRRKSRRTRRSKIL